MIAQEPAQAEAPSRGAAHSRVRVQVSRREALFARLWLLSSLAAVGCEGDLVVLGRSAPAPFRFAPPHAIAELSAPAKTDNPSLSGDQLEIVFTSERAGVPADVWSATRERTDLPFGTPQLVREANSPALETSPALSYDGLTLWIASDRNGGHGDLDVWVLRRHARNASWSSPFNVSELNSPTKDIPRPVGQDGLIMPLGSDREMRGTYQIYFAHRPDLDSDFGPPQRLVLASPHNSSVDGFLTDDGLTLFYCSGPSIGPADLYVSARRSTDEPFGAPVPLDTLNSSSDERDPFLSANGRQFYFSSDRSGQYEIYVADVQSPPRAIAP